ncbi:MAG: hypothetical protein KAI64_03370, partial [Thermoplasmata archaeon]|nr:hypothetical protein [Thermoplasmata archaeon]
MTQNDIIDNLIAKLAVQEIFAECTRALRSQEYDGALECFDRILDSQPDNAEAMFGKAITLERMNEWG